ncbi:MAG TPA: histidine phosphotransferase family protein [Stellaceae bacterium]|nr:histidine phosphotransferase family protein [Stellaceae bacterium]
MQIEFRVLELLASRLCHELISPVGAVNNGVELLNDGDAGFVRDATTLIGQSARRAAMRLQFYRFAYGAGGLGGGAPDAKSLVAGILEGGKVRCDWPAEFDALATPWQKLACNLMLLASETLPRGGSVTLARAGNGVAAAAAGEAVNLTAELKAALVPAADVGALTARTVHAYFTARYAETVGARLSLSEADKSATFTAS